MRRTELRGGANEYKINEVLGENFRIFMEALKTSTLEDYTWGKIEPSEVGTTSDAPKANDVHYYIPEYVMAIAAAFRRIETPDAAKAEVIGKYGDATSSIYKQLISSGAVTGVGAPEKQNFYFIQLPYKHKYSNITHLVPGFHLLPYLKNIYNVGTTASQNSLINTIRYLYHFIAILDPTNLNARNVITFLRQDKLQFMKYVDGVVDLLMSQQYFQSGTNLPSESKNVVREGVLQGLTGIAQQIISELPTSAPGGGKYLPIDNINADSKNSLEKFFQKIGIRDADVLATAFNRLTEQPLDQGENAKNIKDLSEERRKMYAIDSLLNPFFILNGAKTIDSKQIQNLQQNGGDDRRQKRMYGGEDTPALSYLYGPILTADNNPFQVTAENDKQNLTTEGAQGNQGRDAELVNKDLVEKIGTYPFKSGDILSEIIKISGSPDDNPKRVVLLSLLYTGIVKDGKTDLSKLSEQIEKTLAAYRLVDARIKKIPTENFETVFSKFENAFVDEFVLYTQRYFQADQGKLVQPTGPVLQGQIGVTRAAATKQSNLTDPIIWNFYEKTVVPKKDWYNTYFNLVKIDEPNSQNIALDKAAMISESERPKYRLNIKRESGYSRLNGEQRGGAYGDYIFISYLPPYPSNLGDLWFSRDSSYRVPKNLLSEDAIRTIAREVDRQGTDGNVTIFNLSLKPSEFLTVSNRVASRGFGVFGTKDFIDRILRAVKPLDISNITPAWENYEARLSEHMLREQSKWERDGDNFVLKNDKGDTETTMAGDNCKFIGQSVAECLDVFSRCLGDSSSEFTPACQEILEFNFDINPAITKLKEDVMKINPVVAFAILRKLKFGSYLAEEENDPFHGFRRYKVQSVGSWIEELASGADRCGPGTSAAPIVGCDDTRPLRQQLGEDVARKILDMLKDPSKHNFFKYLDILVQWVNANPQVLNPEEVKRVHKRTGYPPVNDSFNIYSHLNPYKPAEVRLRSLSCELERLKSSVVNDLSGSNTAAVISAISSVPFGTSMPLGRPGFVNPVPLANILPMYGGGLFETADELQSLGNPYGHELFSQLYKSLVGSMDSLLGDSKDKRMRLSNTTTQNIESKLDKLKRTEEELRRQITGFIKKNQLFQASHGYVNPFPLENGNFAAVLSKHSNLLNLGSAYNRRAVNLIDMYQTIARAILTKLDDGKVSTSMSTSEYERPLTMGFHPINKKN